MTDRIDFWHPDLAERFVSRDAADQLAARAEIIRRRDNAAEAFPTDDRYGEDLDDLGSLETTDNEAQSLIEASTGRPISQQAGELIQDIEMAQRVIAWSAAAGEPYALPASVGASRRPAVPHFAFSTDLIEAAEGERALHDLDGHASTPSVYCPACTPDPALAYWALESISVQSAREVGHRARYDADRIERERIEARGTVSLTELVRRAEAQAPPMFGLIPAKGVTYLAGSTGTLKTFLAIHWAVGLAISGRKVVFAAGEGIDSFGRRVSAAAAHHGTTLDRLGQRLTIVEAMPDFYRRDEAFDDVLERATRDRPALQIYDHLAIVSGAAAQEQGGPMTTVSQSAHMLAEASGGAVLILAHHGKQAARGIRGHSAVEDQADAILTTLRTRNAPRVTVRVDKNRDGATGQWQRYEALDVAGSLALDHVVSGKGVPDAEPDEVDQPDDDEATPIGERILTALAQHDGPAARADIFASLAETGPELSSSTFGRHMGDLVTEGLVAKTGDRKTTRYALAESPK